MLLLPMELPFALELIMMVPLLPMLSMDLATAPGDPTAHTLMVLTNSATNVDVDIMLMESDTAPFHINKVIFINFR